MVDQSTCMSPSCGITIEGTFKKCPQCGALMRSARSLRAFGWVILIGGLLVVALLSWLAWVFLSAGSFSGTTSEAWLFAAVFAFLILVGLLAFTHGLYMVVTGQTNRVLVRMMLGAVAILIVGSLLSRILRGFLA